MGDASAGEAWKSTHSLGGLKRHLSCLFHSDTPGIDAHVPMAIVDADWLGHTTVWFSWSLWLWV